MLLSFSHSPDPVTSQAAADALESPPDLTEFKTEITEAVIDLVKDGPGEEFAAFVNHYMKDSLEEDATSKKTDQGENISRTARVKDPEASWVQGFVCYNLCLYIKAFGLQSLKQCKVCKKLFDHKGKYAVYCSDGCKKNKGQVLK